MNEFEEKSNELDESQMKIDSYSNDLVSDFYRPTEKLDQFDSKSAWNDMQQQNNQGNLMPPPPPSPTQQGQSYYQPPFQQPVPPQYQPVNPYYPNLNDPQRGLAIASMVLGIISLVLVCVPFFPIITGVIGLILGILGLKSITAKGMAIAGIVMSIIGGIFWILVLGIPIFAAIMDGISGY